MHLEWCLGEKTMKDLQMFSLNQAFFSPVLSNATLCNAPSFGRHMIQASLLNIDVDDPNLFLFV